MLLNAESTATEKHILFVLRASRHWTEIFKDSVTAAVNSWIGPSTDF